MKRLSLLFLFGAETLSSTIDHIVQTASWTPEQAAPLLFFWFYRFFIQIRGRERSCRPGEKWRLQWSAGQLLLLWTEPLSAPPSVRSRRSPRATTSLSCTTGKLFGEWSLMEIDEHQIGGRGVSVDGGWDWTTKDSADDPGKTRFVEKEWILIMFTPLINLHVMLPERSVIFIKY